MNSTNRFSRFTTALRITAAVALLATLGLWVSTGAHTGWTQTSKVTVQHDEITGIDFPVREKTFVAGVEVIAAGAAVAAALAAASVFTNRRRNA